MSYKEENIMFRDFGEYESDGTLYYYIETGIDLDKCRRQGNCIIGTGRVEYYKTAEEYNNCCPSEMEPFKFEWSLVSDRIEIFECEYDKDIDIDNLLDNLKNNLDIDGV